MFIKLIILFVLAFLFAMAFAKTSGEADRRAEEMFRKKEEGASKNHEWCDDDCYACAENQWCKFSEVKAHKEG
jgi:hypothetical protein